MKGKLYIIGAGISLDYLTIKALKILRNVKNVFLDGYTGVLLGDGSRLVEIIGGREYKVLSRRDLEDLNGELIFKALEEGDVALVSPGDALIATTHVNLMIEARRRGYDVEVVPGVSIISASISVSGLMAYKLGKVSTITYPKEGVVYEYFYDVIKENSARNLHTLLLLELDVERGVFMTIRDAIQILFDIERSRGEGVISPNRLAVGISRLGDVGMKVCPDELGKLINIDFGKPPHTLIITSPKLHFIEKDALEVVKDVYCR
ncbi:MAG: diphthine synthase [Sulfolobales archaeon]